MTIILYDIYLCIAMCILRSYRRVGSWVGCKICNKINVKPAGDKIKSRTNTTRQHKVCDIRNGRGRGEIISATMPRKSKLEWKQIKL